MASLRFKKDGTPFVDFRASGQRWRPEFTTVKDAQKFLRLADAAPEEALKFWQESAAQQSSLRIADPDIVSLKGKIHSFNEDYCTKRHNVRDMKRIMSSFESFVLKRHGKEDIDIRAVTLEDLSAFQTYLVNTGITNASVNRYFTTIKTFFKRAARAQYITVNYSALVEGLPIEFKQRTEVWKDGDTPKMSEQLIEDEKDPVYVELSKSMEFTPFGWTDFMRLTWPDVDFKLGEIRTYRMKGRGRRDWIVPIVPGYRKVLMAIKKRQELEGLGGPKSHVYLTMDNKPIVPARVSKIFERTRSTVGIDSVPYTSRHLAITKVGKNQGLRTASKFAGHASVKTTEKHYYVEGEEEFKKKVRAAFAK